MFPFFNKNFLQSMMGEQKTFEFVAPNGSVYRYSSNTIDEDTFKEMTQKLNDAVQNKDQTAFDEAWEGLQQKDGLKSNLEQEFKKLQDEMERFLGESNSIFSGGFGDSFFRKNTLPFEEQIKFHENEIKRLRQQQAKAEITKQKEELERELSALKTKMDAKLTELSQHLDNEEKKKEITDELTNIHHEIKKIEEKIKNA